MSNETVSLRRLRPGETLHTELSKAFDPFAERKDKMRTESAGSPPKERFIRPPAAALSPAPSVAITKDHSPISGNHYLSDRRKKIIAIGWLSICIASIANESGRYSWGTPSLSWLVLLCSTWALLVWLWPLSTLIKLKNYQRFKLQKKRHKKRLIIARKLGQLGLSNDLFVETLNQGRDNHYQFLRKNAASLGWRKMTLSELSIAIYILDVMLEMKRSHINKAEKLIRKRVFSEDDLLTLSKERYPLIENWRSMNHSEIEMIVCIKTGTLPDWAMPKKERPTW